MMKKIILTGCFLYAGTLLFAQEAKKITTGNKNDISVNIGIASPGGNFAKGDYANRASGFASPGVHLNLSGTHYFNKNWGATLLIGATGFGHKGSLSLADGYKEDSGTDSTTLYTKGNNKNFSALIGPAFRIPAGKNFSFSIRALAGYANTHLEGFQLYYEDALDNSLTQKEASGGAFAFQAGLAVKYIVIKGFSILANADYFTSKPKLNIYYDNYVVNSGRKLITYKEAVSGINATLGIGITF